MSERPPVTLEFLAQQQATIIEEQANQRADRSVLIALVRRLDAAVSGLTGEVRALNSQFGQS